uniref:Leucine rich repeat containing 72 n=1 Tax=Latimeria chalumnae TaxID=7897 RepID=M3XIF5_LATCH
MFPFYRGLTEVISLARFRMLKYLWLNNNKIRRLTCLTKNYRLTELYLNNNELFDITGALIHLTSLQILLLHNNQLTKLEETVKELREMQYLQRLNLFNNPLAQEPGYRLFVIHHIPSLEILDRQIIRKEEKKAALYQCNAERSRVLQSIAFGKRVESAPEPKISSSLTPKPTSKPQIYRDGCGFGNSRTKPTFDDPEEAVCYKAVRRSVMQFSSMNWNTVPTSQEKRLAERPAESPQWYKTLHP